MATQNFNFIQVDAVATKGRLLWFAGASNMLINFKHFIVASTIAGTWSRSSCVREVIKNNQLKSD